MEQNDNTHREKIGSYLASKHTLGLATCAGDTPWACSVFYASDEGLNIYFLTDPGTLHGQQLESGRIAATVNENCSQWSEIKGIQLAGTAAIVTGTDRERGLALYLDKFSDVRQAIESPGNDSERLIGEKLSSTPLYRISVDWIRLIDNSAGFGTKVELKHS